MSENIGYLNVEYFFLRFYQFFTGVHDYSATVPDQATALLQKIGILGLVLSLLLLTLIVYFRVRTLQVEHEGLGKLEAQERAHREHAATAAKNQRWEGVVALAISPNDSDWRRAILEADSMLADLLYARGYVGDTLGEQLKGANKQQFTTLDLAWEAHKMRNALAHLGEAFPLSERDTKATIDQYRRVFEEFEYI
ncbi:MAG: hypothetical protein Q7S26_01480 [bacterium]|nr:hypothetical protein [bacterium]